MVGGLQGPRERASDDRGSSQGSFLGGRWDFNEILKNKWNWNGLPRSHCSRGFFSPLVYLALLPSHRGLVLGLEPSGLTLCTGEETEEREDECRAAVVRGWEEPKGRHSGRGRQLHVRRGAWGPLFPPDSDESSPHKHPTPLRRVDGWS